MSTEVPSALDAAVLHAIFHAAVDAIIVIDEQGKMHSVNKAAEGMFGYSSQELVGQNVSMLMPQAHAAAHDGYIQRYLAEGDGRIIGIGREVEGLRSDGRTFPIHLGVSEVTVNGRRLFTGIVQDITERRELERAREALISQLEDANAELERFTYTVSHDLKSPLITIKGFLGSLEKDAVAGNFDRLRSDIGRIGNAADKMKLLLDELLELSRVGRIANPHQELSLTELCNEVVDLLEGPISKHEAQVSVAPNLPTVCGDPVRIREVVQNLVENALKFKSEGEEPRIEIGVRPERGIDVIYVRDNGIGIDSQYKERVFRIFEQLSNKNPGSGIGLALVKRIIGVHGGAIWVESEGIGKGTTVCFTIGEKPASETPPNQQPSKGTS